MKTYSTDGYVMFSPIYRTFDGHAMKEGEIMWRVANNSGKWNGEPGEVIFRTETGYNNFDFHHSPFPINQIHFFDKENAFKYLERFRSFPSVEELNHFISFYKPDYCPCVLGKPFYVSDDCQCGG